MKVIYRPAPAQYPEIIALWERTVRATHDFLSPEDIVFYHAAVASYLPQLRLYCIDEGNALAGFMGTSDEKVQALFIDPAHAGKGLGTELMKFALRHRGIIQVDVNEQNTRALEFYNSLGFEVAGREDRDGAGKAYPVLHLQYVNGK